jgi:hypothetical protein
LSTNAARLLVASGTSTSGIQAGSEQPGHVPFFNCRQGPGREAIE